MALEEVPDRTRRQLEDLPPEKRAKAETAIARTRTPEFRARAAAARAALDEEYRVTGTIATAGAPPFVLLLKRERETRGLSLADVAGRSGIDKAALSRLENGQQPNPTVSTLARYAWALGKRLEWSLTDEPAGASAKP